MGPLAGPWRGLSVMSEGNAQMVRCVRVLLDGGGRASRHHDARLGGIGDAGEGELAQGQDTRVEGRVRPRAATLDDLVVSPGATRFEGRSSVQEVDC